MTGAKRLLLVFQEPQDHTKIIVEFPDKELMKRYREEAESHHIECQQIEMAQYDRTTYRGCRYFDLRNTFTLKSFELEDWLHFLKHWDEHERDDEYGEYKM